MGIADFFDQGLEDMLSAGSPQTVGSELGEDINPTTFREVNFEISANVNAIIFELIAEEANLQILREGVQISESYIDRAFGPLHQLATVNVPFTDNSPALGTEGTWTMRFNLGSNQRTYRAKAQVEDTRLNYTFEAKTANNKVGDPIELTASISYDSTAMDNATVRAIVFKPGQDWGDIVGNAQLPNFDPTSAPEAGSIGFQKYIRLIQQDTGFLSQFELRENGVNLTHTANGNYTATFEDTDLTGVYKIFGFIDNDQVDSLGTINRRVIRTLYLRFDDPDPDLSTQTYTLTGDKVIQLQYKPVYSVGNTQRLVGPGFANGISVTGDDVGNVTVQDNADGSYTISFAGLNGNTNPDVQISLSGVPIYNGPAADFQTSQSLWDNLVDWWTGLGLPFWLLIVLLIILLILIIILIIRWLT